MKLKRRRKKNVGRNQARQEEWYYTGTPLNCHIHIYMYPGPPSQLATVSAPDFNQLQDLNVSKISGTRPNFSSFLNNKLMSDSKYRPNDYYVTELS